MHIVLCSLAVLCIAGVFTGCSAVPTSPANSYALPRQTGVASGATPVVISTPRHATAQTELEGTWKATHVAAIAAPVNTTSQIDSPEATAAAAAVDALPVTGTPAPTAENNPALAAQRNATPYQPTLFEKAYLASATFIYFCTPFAPASWAPL